MPRATSKLTDRASAFDARWKQFHAQTQAEQRPPVGAINSAGYAALNGLTRNKADGFLRRLSQLGKMKTGIFRVMVAGKVTPVRYYWP